jgi:hypothetical protein
MAHIKLVRNLAKEVILSTGAKVATAIASSLFRCMSEKVNSTTAMETENIMRKAVSDTVYLNLHRL